MRKYAQQRVATLLRRLAFCMNRAARLPDPDSIHDLRVATRRFQQSLRVFEQFFPRGQTRKIRRLLRKIMELSGEIRNRDIALDLIQNSGGPAESALSSGWREEKKQFQTELEHLLRRWGSRDLARRWSARLGL